MKIIGITPTVYDFDNKRGDRVHVEGVTLSLSEPHTSPDAVGVRVESVFLSRDKLRGYVPAIDDEIGIGYNKYRKPEFVVRL